MAEKKEINKSEEIRKVAKDLQAKGQKVSPKIIIDLLKKQGITVSSPQCSMVLKRAGFKRRARRARAVGAKPAAARGNASRGAIGIEDLIAAKKVADQFGGAERAIEALRALARLS
ncbi:MAG: hypothetical protein ACOYK7_12255 [Pirellulales bacterium]